MGGDSGGKLLGEDSGRELLGEGSNGELLGEGFVGELLGENSEGRFGEVTRRFWVKLWVKVMVDKLYAVFEVGFTFPSNQSKIRASKTSCKQ
jgi:hypothetical protein